MTIDTEIRHVTKAGANLFLELGFPPAEAKRLHAASRKQINDTRLVHKNAGYWGQRSCQETSIRKRFWRVVDRSRALELTSPRAAPRARVGV